MVRLIRAAVCDAGQFPTFQQVIIVLLHDHGGELTTGSSAGSAVDQRARALI
jgi:hypothetical protein